MYNVKRRRLLVLNFWRYWLLAFAAGLFAFNAAAVTTDERWISTGSDSQPQVHLYFFWSAACPHCLDARPFVEAIPVARPWVTLHSLELSRSPDNDRLYVDMAASLGEQAEAVPALLFCGKMHVGWHQTETTGVEIVQRLDTCRARVLAGHTFATGAPAKTLTIPVIGAIEPGQFSLPLLTIAIAALDAFNPCAFFVLLFLLSLLVHQQHRGRMLTVGGIFVLFSGLMYFAFMAAWLNLFQLLGNLTWVTLAAGALALLVGTVNIKDFFSLNAGLTLSIPEARKPDIYRRARAILAAGSLPTMLAATVFLAVAANFYELLCTAGFPMVYTRLLTLSGLTTSQHYLYLALYNAIYVVPLVLIVLAFVRTMGARKLSEREGRLLKLLSGIMMLELGALLMIAPERLNSLAIAFVLLAAAVAVTGLAARLTKQTPL